MNNQCEKCGGELIKGVMAGMSGLYFYPNNEINKIKPKRSKVICNCCKECGAIQNLYAIDVDKIK